MVAVIITRDLQSWLSSLETRLLEGMKLYLPSASNVQFLAWVIGNARLLHGPSEASSDGLAPHGAVAAM